ncbi:MAG: response regulator [Micavibrio sp.]|nr:response regulator [Micavibrio sp.]
MSAETILVVEPDILVRHPLAQYLRECGYKVLEALDTDEAVEVLTQGSIDVDIVLADVASPGKIDGFGLAKWIRTQGYATRTILAGSIQKAASEAADLCENGPLLEKPYHHTLLVDRIHHTLALRNSTAARKRPKR